MFTGMAKDIVSLTGMESPIELHVVGQAVRDVHRSHGFPRIVEYELSPWCGQLLGALRAHNVFLGRRSEVVTLPTSAPPHRPAHLAAIDGPQRISTMELRRHAFAAYAAAMALHGPEAAFDAAVNETLRRTANWGLRVAVLHTRRFVVPAYEAAFPGSTPRRDR